VLTIPQILSALLPRATCILAISLATSANTSPSRPLQPSPKRYFTLSTAHLQLPTKSAPLCPGPVSYILPPMQQSSSRFPGRICVAASAFLCLCLQRAALDPRDLCASATCEPPHFTAGVRGYLLLQSVFTAASFRSIALSLPLGSFQYLRKPLRSPT
jgi:hypothetical protein